MLIEKQVDEESVAPDLELIVEKIQLEMRATSQMIWIKIECNEETNERRQKREGRWVLGL